MANLKVYAKRNDSEAVLRLSGDLTGATVRVPCTSGNTELPDIPAEITNASRGEVTLDISGLAIGSYLIVFEVLQDTKEFTFPNKGYVILIIGDDIN